MNAFEANLTDAPPAPPWGDIHLPGGFEINADGVWFQPPPPKPSKANPEPAAPPPVKICGRCWVVNESRRYDSSSWGLHIHFFDKDSTRKEKNFSQFELTRSQQSARDLVAKLADEGLYITQGEESLVVAYLRSFNTVQRVRWTEQIGWLEGPNFEFVLPQTEESKP